MFSAHGLSERFAANRNLALPQRPAFADDLIGLRLPQGSMAFIGSTAPILLNGRSVNELLPSLLPLLRRGPDLPALRQAAGPALRPVVDDLMHFLFARGLLVEQQGRTTSGDARSRRHLQFFERYCSELSLSNGAAPVARLAEGWVLLVDGEGSAEVDEVGHVIAAKDQAIHQAGIAGGQKAVAMQHPARHGSPASLCLTPLHQSLQALGLQVRRLTVASLESGHDLPAATDASPVLVVLQPTVLARLTAPTLQRLQALGWRWVPLQSQDGQLLLGPIVQTGARACAACLHAADATPGRHGKDDVVWSTAAHALQMLLADALTSHWSVNRLRIDASSLGWQSEGWTPRSTCPQCGCPAQDAPERSGAGFVAAYHRHTQDLPVRGTTRAHLLSYEPAQEEKVRGAAKPYNGPHWRWDLQAWTGRPLRHPVTTPNAGAQRHDALQRALSWATQCVLWQQGGDSEGAVARPASGRTRAMPSAGSLASQSLYLINLQEDDDTAGVHYLHPEGRAYPVASVAAARALGVDALLGGAAVGLVATAALARLESKYGRKAYRFAHYDSGVMLASLQALAREQGTPWRFLADLDDAALSELLGLDGRTEIVCWIAAPAVPSSASTSSAVTSSAVTSSSISASVLPARPEPPPGATTVDTNRKGSMP